MSTCCQHCGQGLLFGVDAASRPVCFDCVALHCSRCELRLVAEVLALAACEVCRDGEDEPIHPCRQHAGSKRALCSPGDCDDCHERCAECEAIMSELLGLVAAEAKKGAP
jgi:hypothetical protein